MGEVINVTILGIVQGLAEFLPVSSSGHLILAHAIFPTGDFESLAYDVALHLGTLLAVCIALRADIARLFNSFMRVVSRQAPPQEARQVWFLLVSMIPAAIFGFAFKDVIESSLRSVGVVSITLIIGGVLFVVLERLRKSTRNLDVMTWKDALIVGAAQAVALIPGVSRSGASIIAGLSLGFDRASAVRYSFLLSIPTIGAALLASAGDFKDLFATTQLMAVGLWGILVSCITGLLAIRLLTYVSTKASLEAFGWYRIVVGAIAFTLFFIL